jgi:preprotein translocase subunit YajC
MKIPTSITIVLTSIVWLILLYFSLIYHDSERDKELKTISRNLEKILIGALF